MNGFGSGKRNDSYCWYFLFSLHQILCWNGIQAIERNKQTKNEKKNECGVEKNRLCNSKTASNRDAICVQIFFSSSSFSSIFFYLFARFAPCFAHCSLLFSLIHCDAIMKYRSNGVVYYVLKSFSFAINTGG